MNALVVDDSRAMRRVIGSILAGVGFRVAEAADGREALARFAENGPVDLAVVDWNMPGMNGIELVRAVRGDPHLAGVRVVMATTENDPVKVAEAFAAGADGYVVKPFTRELFVGHLRQLGIGPGAGP